MNEFSRTPSSPRADNERSRRGLPIALTLIILVVGGMGIIKFQGSKQEQRQAAPVEEFVPGTWEGTQELVIRPSDRPEEPVLIEYTFAYSAVPTYGGDETISNRLQVFKKEAKQFLGPMRKQDLTSPRADEMIQPALFEVLERSLFPRARGRLTEFAIQKIHTN